MSSGFYNPIWMLKTIIILSRESNLRLAVSAVVDRLYQLWEEDDEVDIEEIFDLLVQACATGSYVPGDLDPVDRQVEMWRRFLDTVDGVEVNYKECDNPDCPDHGVDKGESKE